MYTAPSKYIPTLQRKSTPALDKAVDLGDEIHDSLVFKLLDEMMVYSKFFTNDS